MTTVTPIERNRVNLTFTVTEGEPAKHQRNPHRRQQGVQRIDPAEPVRPGHRRLAQLVHQVEPLFARQAQCRPGNPALVLPQPRLPRVPRRLDPGRDLAQQAGHLDHGQRDRGRAFVVCGRQARGQLPGQGRRVQVAGHDQAGRALQRRRRSPRPPRPSPTTSATSAMPLPRVRGHARNRPRHQSGDARAAGRARRAGPMCGASTWPATTARATK